MAQPATQTDRDLASIHEARMLVRRARAAAPVLAELTQEQVDAIVDAMAAAATPQAEPLARLAHEETGFGVIADKIQKNLFSSQKIYKFIRPMKTVGVIRRLEDRKVVEIAEPFGVVAAIVPSTNPDTLGHGCAQPTGTESAPGQLSPAFGPGGRSDRLSAPVRTPPGPF